VKRIFHLISSNGFYGAENVLVEICSGLQLSSRFEPVIGLLDTGNGGHLPLLEECERKKFECKVFVCRGRYDKKLIKDLKTFIQSKRIDVIHTHGYKSNFYAFFVRSTGCKLVSTCHNWLVSDFKMQCFVWLDKFLLRFFDVVVAVSGPIEKELHKWGMAGKTLLVYNGISLERFRRNSEQRKRVRDRLGLADSDIVFGFVGRVCREKGVEILLESGRRIKPSFPEMHIVLVGDGEMLALLEKENDEYVHPVGVQTGVGSFYSAFDVFVLPSLNEGLPMVILEAMAARLPVIATLVGSIPDVVEDGRTGCLVEADDSVALFKAMEKLLRNHEQMSVMAERGFQKVSQTFTSGRMVQEYITIYDSLPE